MYLADQISVFSSLLVFKVQLAALGPISECQVLSGLPQKYDIATRQNELNKTLGRGLLEACLKIQPRYLTDRD